MGCGEIPKATLLVLSSDSLGGFPLGTASSGLKLRAIFSQPVAFVDLDKITAANGALDSFTLKTFDNTTSSLTLLLGGAPVTQLNSTQGDPSADRSAWRGLLGPVALDFYVRPAHSLTTVNITLQAGAFADASGIVNVEPASVALFYDPTNPVSLPDFPFVSSIDQTSVTLTFSFTKTCTVNYTLVNQPIGYGPGNWTTLPNPQQKLDPLKTGASVNGSVVVLAGKVARVTVGGLAPNQGYLLLVSAIDQYGNQAQAVSGAALRTRDVAKGAVGDPSLTPGPVAAETAEVFIATASSGDTSTLRYATTPFNPNSLVPTQTAIPSCDPKDTNSQIASNNGTLQFSSSVIVSAIACGNGTSSNIVDQPVATQAAAPILTLPAGPFFDAVSVGLLYNGSMPNTTIKYTFTPAGSPVMTPACPYTGWAGYGRKTAPQADITLTASGTLQAVACSNAGLVSDVVSSGPIFIRVYQTEASLLEPSAVLPIPFTLVESIFGYDLNLPQPNPSTHSSPASAPRVIQTDASLLAPYTVSLNTSTPGATIRYIHSPLTGPVLTSPLTCNTPEALVADVITGDVVLWESGVLTAITCKDGIFDSDVTVKRLTLQASPPKFTPTKGLGPFNLTITTRTSGALLLYTSDPKIPLRCPSLATLSGGSSGPSTSAPPSNFTLAPTVFSGTTPVVVPVTGTALWRATACPAGGVSLSPSAEVNATVVVAQIDPSLLPAGQAQVTAEVTILDANLSIFNDTKAQLRFETAIASAISLYKNLNVSPNNVIVTSIVLAGPPAGPPAGSAGRSTLETGPRFKQTGTQRRLLASNQTSANATSAKVASVGPTSSTAPSNQSLPSITVSSAPQSSNASLENSDPGTNTTSLVVQFTVVTTPVLAPAVRSALTASVQNGTLASALTGAGFKVGGSSGPVSGPPVAVSSSSLVPTGASAPGAAQNVTNGTVVPVSVTAANGVALTATGLQFAAADAQNCVFTAQSGGCTLSPSANKQCARLVNYTLITAAGPAGTACPVGLSPLLTRVQAFEGCPVEQCGGSGGSGGSSLPVGVWVVIAVLIAVLFVTLIGGLILYRARSRRAREPRTAKDPETTWQAPVRSAPTASHFQSGGDVGMRGAPMWDSATVARAGHSDVADARERQAGAEEGSIVDFETYCEAWDRRFVNSAGGRQAGPIHTTSDAGDETSTEPIHTGAEFEDKPVDDGHVAIEERLLTKARERVHTEAEEPCKKKQRQRTLSISYDDTSPIVDPLNVESSASGPIFDAPSLIAPTQSPMHADFLDQSKSGSLVLGSALSSPAETSAVNTALVSSEPEGFEGANAAAKRVRAGGKGFSEDSMEEVVLEMMRIDQESVARPGFASPAGAAKPQGLGGVWEEGKVTEKVTSVEGGAVTLTAFENWPLTAPQQETVNEMTSQIRVGLTPRDVSPSMMRRGGVPLPARNPSPGNGSRNPGLPPRGLPVTGAKTPGLPRSTSPGLPRSQSPAEGAGKMIHRSSTPPYSAAPNPESSGLPRRAKTPDLLQRPREALTRYSQGFLTHRSSPSTPIKGRPESGELVGTEAAPESAEKRRSKSCERPRERSDSDERIDRELKNLIVQMKEGMECPEPLVVNFDDKDGVSAEGVPADGTGAISDAVDASKEGGNGSRNGSGTGSVKRSESLSKLGKRIGSWMKGEPRGIPSVPVSEIHVVNRTSEKLEAGSVTDADDDRSSMMGDSERSVGSTAVAHDPQGFRVWAWLRTAAHPDARSVVSEPDAAEMRASEPEVCASDPEMGEVHARVEGDSSGEASFWKKRIFGRSLSTMTFNSPPKDGAQEEQRQQLRPSWAAVSY
ncbi:hypothetical protein KFL_003220130 [Klebsormidium nitens]|uniref:Uncharacterized protein n=1 Tax=Klebsormidium nitens TaxID=105231 RepID=A0A1Y1ICX2_KLENI|nr:hypothetical protein KFL_003220130 [Klebsormidium nitens]|eukprot:GAQ86951.1 hypothetical protein KFL_003220130 [Klebsormidium nitens]